MSTPQSIRGMHDLLPAALGRWQKIETTTAHLLARYGYRELRFPVLEKTALFTRTIGTATDIVAKEMYSFADRNGDNLSLRPEGTAGCVRACLQHRLLDRPQRLWYRGPMFRHERPQKGRLRQFHQLGVEIFGLPGPDIDAELLALCARLWQELGLQDALQLEINSLGNQAARQAHRAALLDYLNAHRDQLDADSQRRLTTNPLRILDSKNPQMQDLIAAAPALPDFLDPDSAAHFDQLRTHLDALGIAHRLNPRLVRGLDYYTRTVFEWTTDRLGTQGTLCGGGRYDDLVAQLGGPPTAALGFGLGLERLILLLDQVHGPTAPRPQADLYLVSDQPTAPLILAEKLRTALPHLAIQNHCGGGSFKTQFKKADRSGAQIALILGPDERAADRIGIKHLRALHPQETLPLTELLERLRSLPPLSIMPAAAQPTKGIEP